MNMTKILFIAGAPGSGKSTISNLLKAELNDCPLIDFGRIREFHLNRSWSNANKKEEQMSFENLVFILKNYIKNEYKYVIVNDLRDYRIVQIPQIFDSGDYIVFTLLVNTDEELTSRVLDKTRDSGFRDVKQALEWNKMLIERKILKNEFKIDNTGSKPKETLQAILQIVSETEG